MWLSKHQALGNDFLVLVDPGGVHPLSPALARAACDRHRGVGADGVLHASQGIGEADVIMQLFNADGGRAEMSGNGVACLVQAAVMSGLGRPPEVRVSTDAGMRTIAVEPAAEPRSHWMTVDMGAAKVGDDEPDWLDHQVVRAARVDIGNPHLVLHIPEPGVTVDLTSRGRVANETVHGGINVEVIWLGPGDDELSMAVYERGVGLTMACGTGACAAAAAARNWELIGDTVRVLQPGGPCDISLGDTISMRVPVQYVATVDFPWP